MISISEFPSVGCFYSGTTQTLLPPSHPTSLTCVVVKSELQEKSRHSNDAITHTHTHHTSSPHPLCTSPHESFSGQVWGGSLMPTMKPVTVAAPKASSPPSPFNPILWWGLSHQPLSRRHSAVNCSPSGSSERERDRRGREEENRTCGRGFAEMDHWSRDVSSFEGNTLGVLLEWSWITKLVVI